MKKKKPFLAALGCQRGWLQKGIRVPACPRYLLSAVIVMVGSGQGQRTIVGAGLLRLRISMVLLNGTHSKPSITTSGRKLITHRCEAVTRSAVFSQLHRRRKSPPRAGTSKSSPYHYYPSRKDILFDVQGL